MARINGQFFCYDLGVSMGAMSYMSALPWAVDRTRVVLPGWLDEWHTLLGCDAQDGVCVPVRMESDYSSEDYGGGDNLAQVFRFVRRAGVWVEDAEG